MYEEAGQRAQTHRTECRGCKSVERKEIGWMGNGGCGEGEGEEEEEEVGGRR